MAEKKILELREALIDWMDNALMVIDDLREENRELRIKLASMPIREVIKEVPVPTNDKVIRIDGGVRVCRCGRMEVEKGSPQCYWCKGESVTLKRRELWKKKKNEIRPS